MRNAPHGALRIAVAVAAREHRRRAHRTVQPAAEDRVKPRTWTVRPRDAGKPLATLVAVLLRLPRPRAVELIRQGHVRLQGQVCRQPQQALRAGQRVTTASPLEKKARSPAPPRAPRAPQAKAPAAFRVVYQDADIVVVDKPAGLTTVRHAEELNEAGPRARRFLPPTLVDLVPSMVKGPAHGRFRVRAVHRLDRDTSGLVVLARTAEAERHLGQQFRAHTIERRYVALVRGTPVPTRIESFLVRDRGDGRRGSGPTDEGQRAVTHVSVRETWPGYGLVECRLETGRTHQVRIHLAEQGTPLCGERVYDRPLHGKPLPDGSGARRPMLHAESLAIDHPATGRRMTWTAEPPDDFERLRRQLSSPQRP
jgi:23S rRNA pseudouridine1911/1915/1917 synthase